MRLHRLADIGFVLVFVAAMLATSACARRHWSSPEGGQQYWKAP